MKFPPDWFFSDTCGWVLITFNVLAALWSCESYPLLTVINLATAAIMHYTLVNECENESS